MKVALCFSGMPRFWKETYNNFKKYIVDRYDTDVYIHSWETNEYSYGKHIHSYHNDFFDKNDMLEKYYPKKYLFENPESLSIDYSYTEPNMLPISIKNVQSMYYSIKKCNDLIEDVYDVVIRARFDLMIKCEIDIIRYDLTKINTVRMNHFGIFPYSSDIFFFSDMKNMKSICNLYDDIQIICDSVVYNPEIMLTEYIRMKNILTDYIKEPINILRCS